MSDDTEFARMSKKELQKLYGEVTRNLSPKRREAIERSPVESPHDSPHTAHVKKIYRALTPHLAGNGHYENGQFHNHA